MREGFCPPLIPVGHIPGKKLIVPKSWDKPLCPYEYPVEEDKVGDQGSCRVDKTRNSVTIV